MESKLCVLKTEMQEIFESFALLSQENDTAISRLMI